MTHGLPLLDKGWKVGMVFALLVLRRGGEWSWSPSITLLEGREQGGKVAMVPALLILRSGGELPWSSSIPLLEGREQGGKVF